MKVKYIILFLVGSLSILDYKYPELGQSSLPPSHYVVKYAL